MDVQHLTEEQHHKHNKGKFEDNGSVSQVGSVVLYGIPIVSLVIDRQERLCLAQISNTLLKEYSYNEIHNRRVALGITCVQCTPVQLEILRRAGAMPISSRRCGMITKREAERLCKSFLGDNAPPKLPDHFAFDVFHECAWGCRGSFVPSRYNSSRAKCIKCSFCNLFFSPNKFIFHSHRLPDSKYIQPDAANFNSWRRHMKLAGTPHDDIIHAWEDVKAMFNGGTRKRMLTSSPTPTPSPSKRESKSNYNSLKAKNINITPPPPAPPPVAPTYTAPTQISTSPRIYPEKPYELHRSFVDYVWSQPPSATKPFHFSPYSLPWLKRPLLAFGPAAVAAAAAAGDQEPSAMPLSVPVTSGSAIVAAAAALSHHLYSSAFRPVGHLKASPPTNSDDEDIDIETTDDDIPPCWSAEHAVRPVSPHHQDSCSPRESSVSPCENRSWRSNATTTLSIPTTFQHYRPHRHLIREMSPDDLRTRIVKNENQKLIVECPSQQDTP